MSYKTIYYGNLNNSLQTHNAIPPSIAFSILLRCSYGTGIHPSLDLLQNMYITAPVIDTIMSFKTIINSSSNSKLFEGRKYKNCQTIMDLGYRQVLQFT